MEYTPHDSASRTSNIIKNGLNLFEEEENGALHFVLGLSQSCWNVRIVRRWKSIFSDKFIHLSFIYLEK